MTARPAELGPALRKRSKGPAAVRDKEATLGAILSAAEAEFSRYGLPGARVAEIARNAGVTKGLIFHYFESKEHLFEAVLFRAGKPLRPVLAEIEASTASPSELLRLIIERFMEALATHPLPHLLFTLESIQNNGEHYRKLKLPSLFSTLEHVLEKGMKQGCFGQLDPALTAINIVGVCTYYYSAIGLNPNPDLRREPFGKDRMARHAREVLRFVEAGTTAGKGQPAHSAASLITRNGSTGAREVE